MNKYAITTLLFGDKKYITGAIINAYLHKKFIQKYNLSIDATIMLDNKLIEYKEELEKYYDKVYAIDLFETKISDKTDLRRYISTMKYMTNKVQMFNLIEYEKVLFTDIDFLPIKKDFYTIFNLDTPAFYSVEINCNKSNEVIEKNMFIDLKLNEKYIVKDDYHNIIKNMKKSINASLMLVKPSNSIYNEFLKFKKKAENNEGIITSYGVDEILILTFMLFVIKSDIHCIPRNFRTKAHVLNNKVLAVNFASAIKPWIRLPVLQWAEENIWHIVAKKALTQSKIITNIYIESLINNFKEFSKKSISNEDLNGYNIKIFKTEGKDQFDSLMKYILKNDVVYNDNELEKIKYIMDESKKMHSYIETDISEIYNNIINII